MWTNLAPLPPDSNRVKVLYCPAITSDQIYCEEDLIPLNETFPSTSPSPPRGEVREGPVHIWSVSGIVGQEVGYLEDIEGSWQDTRRTVSSLTSSMTLVDPKEQGIYSKSFVLISLLKVCKGIGCQKGGYLKDNEGSYPDTWMTGLSKTLWMYWVDP